MSNTVSLGTTTQPVAAEMTTGTDPASQAKLVDAAHQFEGILLEQMLKSMQVGKDGDDSDESSDGGQDTMRSFGVQAMAQAISQRGGLGIAQQIIQKVTSESDHRVAKKST